MLIRGKNTRVIFPGILLLILAAGCFVVLRPFLSAVLWAAILAYSTWPIYRHLHASLPRLETLTAALMTLAVAAVIVVPFVVVGSKLVENSAPVVNAVRAALEHGMPSPPAWIAQIPLIGPALIDYLAQVAQDGSSVASHLREWVGPAQVLILQTARTIGSGLLGLALSVLILFFLYRDGNLITDHLTISLGRLGGPMALRLLAVAGSTIRGVVYGIIGTALAQGALAALGFALMKVPGALFLGFVTFFFSFLPMGPPFVWVPVVLWVALDHRFAAAIFLAIWGFIVVSGVDNLLKPYLISRAGDLPFILVLLGAFGGVLAFGLIGVFIGPILLALGYNLILEWGAAEPVGGGE